MGSKKVASIFTQIKSRILTSGPIPVAEYMKMALTSQSPQGPGIIVKLADSDSKLTSIYTSSNSILRKIMPSYNEPKKIITPPALNASSAAAAVVEPGASGYYMNKDVFGEMGDFITSPEISQIFGELIGIWALQTWMQMGGPKSFNIVEFGPGRGTMAKDILRVFGKFEHLTKNDVKLHLVEISPYLANVQYKNLCCSSLVDNQTSGKKRTKKKKSSENSQIIDPMKEMEGKGPYHKGETSEYGFPVYWYRDVYSLPHEFCFYVAHEFFDALPIHKFQKVENTNIWRELLIDVNDTDPELGEDEEALRFVLARHETPAIKLLKNRFKGILEDHRNHIEISLEAAMILEELANRIEEKGGLGLIVDYGHDGTKEDTFRGFLKHSLHDPLVNPGLADLTADVDFSFVRKICQDKLWVNGPTTQREFLERLGINVRLQKLLENAKTEEVRKQLTSAHKMLMEEMGERFKFLALFPKVLEKYKTKLKIAGFQS